MTLFTFHRCSFFITSNKNVTILIVKKPKMIIFFITLSFTAFLKSGQEAMKVKLDVKLDFVQINCKIGVYFRLT